MSKYETIEAIENTIKKIYPENGYLWQSHLLGVMYAIMTDEQIAKVQDTIEKDYFDHEQYTNLESDLAYERVSGK